jgi:hypothetical protein
MSLHDEAETCRGEVRSLAGTPEAPFLMRLAGAFEELALMTEHLSRRAYCLRNSGVTEDTQPAAIAVASMPRPAAAWQANGGQRAAIVRQDAGPSPLVTSVDLQDTGSTLRSLGRRVR